MEWGAAKNAPNRTARARAHAGCSQKVYRGLVQALNRTILIWAPSRLDAQLSMMAAAGHEYWCNTL